MIPSRYDIGDLMEMTDEEYDRGYEVSSGLCVSMPADDDRGNRVWVSTGRRLQYAPKERSRHLLVGGCV